MGSKPDTGLLITPQLNRSNPLPFVTQASFMPQQLAQGCHPHILNLSKVPFKSTLPDFALIAWQLGWVIII